MEWAVFRQRLLTQSWTSLSTRPHQRPLSIFSAWA